MKKKALVMLAACAMALALAGLAGCGGSGSASSASGSGSGSGGDNAASSEEQKEWHEATYEDFAFYAEFPDGCDIVSSNGLEISADDTHRFDLGLPDPSKGPAKNYVESYYNPNQRSASTITLGDRTWYTTGENQSGYGYPVSHYATDLSDGRVVSLEVIGYDFNGPEVRTFLETFEVRGE